MPVLESWIGKLLHNWQHLQDTYDITALFFRKQEDMLQDRSIST